MNFYIENDLLKYKNKNKKTVIGLIAAALATIILTVVFCLLAKRENHVLIQLINTVLTAACAFLIIYKVDTAILRRRKIIKHYQLVSQTPKTEFSGVISKIGGIITDNSGLRVREIDLVADGRNYCFYLLEDFSFDFAGDDEVKLIIAKKYIVSSLIIEKPEKESYE